MNIAQDSTGAETGWFDLWRHENPEFP